MPNLLDTQAFIFALNASTIPPKTRKLMESDCLLSMASVWEMSIKIGLWKLKLPAPLKEVVQMSVAQGLKLLPIHAEHLYYLETLPMHHKDPFDRLIIAQAITEKLPIIGCDEMFDRYDVKRIW